jgi:hypothetical protein
MSATSRTLLAAAAFRITPIARRLEYGPGHRDRRPRLDRRHRHLGDRDVDPTADERAAASVVDLRLKWSA